MRDHKEKRLVLSRGDTSISIVRPPVNGIKSGCENCETNEASIRRPMEERVRNVVVELVREVHVPGMRLLNW